MVDNLKISCVIPTCDRSDFLDEAVKSVLNQTLPADEIIIVNNGKNALKQLDSWQGKVTVYDIVPYAGVAQARNFGTAVAKGEYLAFLDDDDLWSPSYLEEVAKAISKGAECMVSRIDKLENGKISDFKNAEGKLKISTILTFNPGITGSNVVISKEMFFRLGGFDPKLPPSEDKSLLLEALRIGARISTLSENQAIRRIHPFEHLSSAKKMAEGISQFTRKYSNLMNLRQKLANWLKIYRYRYEGGHKKSLVPFLFIYVTIRIIKLFDSTLFKSSPQKHESRQ